MIEFKIMRDYDVHDFEEETLYSQPFPYFIFHNAN